MTVPEIFQILKINNHDISEEKISKINDQLNIIQNIIENKRFQNYDKNDFQNWTKNDLPNVQFDENNADRSTAFILGMISLALKKNKGYFLRNTQLIAILLFISKEKKQGLIEEVSTGEGKSCIIASLCIYFALRKHKVDVISSSYTLAQRDSDEFQYLYNFFNLKTSYPFNSNSEPYTVDILYGTFLEFEGDCLRDMAYNRNIRNKRPFDVIIIDEVDNLFIDNILGSTRLTNSSLGFKFLIPIYLLLYLMFELIEYVFLLMFKINLDNLEGQEKTKKKFENLIKNPQKRKEELVKFFEKDIDSAFNLGIINPKKDDVKYKKEFNKEEFKDRFNKAGLSMGEYLGNLDKFVETPEFLEDFKRAEGIYWFDSAYDAKNIMVEEIDYVEIINRHGHRDIAPVDRSNTGETQLSTVYGEGLHQMIEIKHKFRVNDETLVHTFLSHITFFNKYKNENEFLFFGLTGTIGNKETQAIYRSKYIDSQLLFIPQYKKKKIYRTTSYFS